MYPRRAIVIVGTVRNGGPLLLERLERLQDCFTPLTQPHWFVVESDSSDGTPSTLATARQHIPNFDFVSLGVLQDDIPSRTARLAHCRNEYLRAICQAPAYSSADYVAIADLDGVNDALTSEAVGTAFEREDWTAVTANQTDAYYDIWALRHPAWSPCDCWESVRFLRAHGIDPKHAQMSAVYSRMIQIPPAAPWIEVESAFGGLAIYKRSALVGARYVGTTADGREVCEHVSLNAHIRKSGGRIFVNPAMINCHTNDHIAPAWERIRVARGLT
jgi:hypothetical protein